MAFWFGINSMIRSAGSEISSGSSSSISSIPQTCSRALLPVLLSSNQQPQRPSQLLPTTEHHQNQHPTPTPTPLLSSHPIPPKNPFQLLHSDRHQQDQHQHQQPKSEVPFRRSSSPFQRLQLQLSPAAAAAAASSSPCSYCLTGTGFMWAAEEEFELERGFGFGYGCGYGCDEARSFRGRGLRCRWREWDG